MKTNKITRRKFVARSAKIAAASFAAIQLAPLNAFCAANPTTSDIRQATGVKAGEVTDTTARVWVRLTESATRNRDGVVIKGHVKAKADKKTVTVPISQLEGACPGASGKARLRYGTKEDLSDASTTDWMPISVQGDFTHQFKLAALKPGTTYYYTAETTDAKGAAKHGAMRGRFVTAPAPTQSA